MKTSNSIGGSRGGARDATPPPRAQNFFIFMQFSGKIGQIIGWRPPPSGVGAPSLWEILDPPLNSIPHLHCETHMSFQGRQWLITCIVSNFRTAEYQFMEFDFIQQRKRGKVLFFVECQQNMSVIQLTGHHSWMNKAISI